MFERPQSENQEQQEARDLSQVLERLQGTGLFDAGYLSQAKLVLYGKNETRVFEHGQFQPGDRELFRMEDFMMGRRTDFVGIHPRAEFELMDYAKIPDQKALPWLFVGGRFSFEQLVAHELAHNDFDIHYQQAFGPYEEHDGVTDVSEAYRAQIKNRLIALAGEFFPGLDMGRFAWTRQQIAEISAFLAEREACRRLGINEEAQGEIKAKVARFLAAPEEEIARFNLEQGRQCALSDMYIDNHVLSIFLAPAIEQKFPEYVDRQAIFYK